ncbi:GNAT family N-acetyltransferase [Sessilibacter corallicola]|uniref:GNAT family N-acetyltransferase n=1 Tax=Sessilibacter corallicola TaxID=2904075 RepID=UPI001E4FC0AB|nr:GNAT family N-acetyltransferase [Sessilibacter corallicola]MCE2027823.1 GNAT family N-acetyltransferase [Sessilibacter corallicola]
MATIYRQADLADLPTLLEFEQGVIEAERPYNTSIMDSPVTYYDIAELIRNDDSVVVVAQAGERIVASGYALIRESRPYFDHKLHAYLGFMYVHPEFRGMGINQKIIEELTQWSKAKGIEYAYLDVYSGNDAAIKAYEKAGFESSIINMKMKLS